MVQTLSTKMSSLKDNILDYVRLSLNLILVD